MCYAARRERLLSTAVLSRSPCTVYRGYIVPRQVDSIIMLDSSCSAEARHIAASIAIHAGDTRGSGRATAEHLCTVSALSSRESVLASSTRGASDIGCALRLAGIGLGGTRSFTAVLLAQSSSEAARAHRRSEARHRPPATTGSMRLPDTSPELRRTVLASRGEYFDGSSPQSREALLGALLWRNASRAGMQPELRGPGGFQRRDRSSTAALDHLRTTIRIAEAPTVRALNDERLARGACSLLVLRMTGENANVRQALRIDLPHLLLLGSPGALVIAQSENACKVFPPGVKARDLNASDKYSGPFGPRFREQCWANRWEDLVVSSTLTAAGTTGGAGGSIGHGSDDGDIAARAAAAATAETASGASATCKLSPVGVGQGRRLACSARLSGRSLCQRRPPLLLNATREAVKLPESAPLLWRAARYFSAIDCDEVEGEHGSSMGRGAAGGRTAGRATIASTALRSFEEKTIVAARDTRTLPPAAALAHALAATPSEMQRGSFEATDPSLLSPAAALAAESEAGFELHPAPSTSSLPPPPVCLIFKSDTQEVWVGGLLSFDGLIFPGEPALVYPKHARKWPRDEVICL